jgi:hypothetical protein
MPQTIKPVLRPNTYLSQSIVANLAARASPVTAKKVE